MHKLLLEIALGNFQYFLLKRGVTEPSTVFSVGVPCTENRCSCHLFLREINSFGNNHSTCLRILAALGNPLGQKILLDSFPIFLEIALGNRSWKSQSSKSESLLEICVLLEIFGLLEPKNRLAKGVHLYS